MLDPIVRRAVRVTERREQRAETIAFRYAYMYSNKSRQICHVFRSPSFGSAPDWGCDGNGPCTNHYHATEDFEWTLRQRVTVPNKPHGMLNTLQTRLPRDLALSGVRQDECDGDWTTLGAHGTMLRLGA